MALQYKFVELSIVTDETLEETVNEWVARGWNLEGIRFVTTEHSKRPAMAFVSFTREMAAAFVDREPPRVTHVPRPPLPPLSPDDEGPRVITAGADEVE
jgi:hypothetical protein